MMKKRLFVFAFLAFSAAAFFAQNRPATEIYVLQKLWQAAGQFRFERPELVFSAENKKVAAYFPAKNRIVLDEKARSVCRSLGSDSTAAFAFLIGHELAHAFQKEVRDGRAPTNFLSYDRAFSASVRSETAADLHGILTAWLAGFDVQKAVPRVLEKMYETYGLVGLQLAGYPPLEERKRAAETVLATVEELTFLFEASSFLAVAGRQDLAAAALAHVEKYHAGRETANNLGVLWARAAMDIFDPKTDRFIWPFELDWSSPLKKSERSRGETGLDAAQNLVRDRFLEKAEACFERALEADPNYSTAQINRACARAMRGKPTEAKAFLDAFFARKKRKKGSKPTDGEQMTRALAEAVGGNLSAARGLFQSLEGAENPLVALAAEFNRRELEGEAQPDGAVEAFSFPPLFLAQTRGLKLPTGLKNAARTRLDDAGRWFSFEKISDDETAFSLGDAGGPTVSFLRKKNRLAPNLRAIDGEIDLERAGFENAVAAAGGFFLIDSRRGEALLKTDRAGRVLEMVRVFWHE